MIDVDVTEDGLHAVDMAKNELAVDIDGWAPGGGGFEIDRRVQTTTSGIASGIRFPLSAVTIEELDSPSWHFAVEDERTSVGRGTYLIQVENSVTMFIRVDGAFELRQDYGGNESRLSFPEPTEVTFGFRSHEKRPDGRIRIPPSPEGIASALTAMGTYHETGTPDRSYPSMRRHPPVVEVDESARPHVPNSGASSSVCIELPCSLEDLFVVAPLAYYLSAEVVVGNRRDPVVLTGDRQFRPRRNEPVPEWAGSLLERVFYLDCLVRNAGPYSADISEMRLVEEISIDIEETYDLPIDRRLVEYMDVDFDGISDGFPEWPLCVFVEPRPSNVRAIPYLLNKLALVHPPESEILDPAEIVSRSLDGFQRPTEATRAVSSTAPPVLHRPRERHATSQGWIADGAVTDGFKCPPRSFSNGLERLGESPGDVSVVVVLNERGMRAERSDVVRTYRQRGEELPISVEERSGMKVGELRDVLESPRDFVHYIGHCDDEGLRCADGHLDVDYLRESRVRMFFLNACGSYGQGLSLIQKGSLAGAVTTNGVIDSQAEKVGASLAKLLMYGFSLKRSVDLARRESIMSRQYVVLGDGTNSLIQGQSSSRPIIVVIEPTGNDLYTIRYREDGFSSQGGLFKPFKGPGPALFGNPVETRIGPHDLMELLEQNRSPVIYDDTLYWPDELLDELF